MPFPLKSLAGLLTFNAIPVESLAIDPWEPLNSIPLRVLFISEKV